MSADPAIAAAGLHASRGKHLNATDGTCLMELVSVLAGEPFTDQPSCVHPTLAALARQCR